MCSFVKALPTGTIIVDGQPVNIAGLQVIVQRLACSGLTPSETDDPWLLGVTRVRQPISSSEEAAFGAALVHAYGAFCAQRPS